MLKILSILKKKKEKKKTNLNNKMSLLQNFSNILILKNPLKDKKLCLFARFIIQVIYIYIYIF